MRLDFLFGVAAGGCLANAANVYALPVASAKPKPTNTPHSTTHPRCGILLEDFHSKGAVLCGRRFWELGLMM